MTAIVPETLIVGDSWSWTATFADYPASTWSLTFYFQNGSKSFSVATSASGDDFAATKIASDTAALEPGRYRWRARVASGADAITVADGWTELDPDPAIGTSDLRSDARKMLDAVDAFLIGNASTAQASMQLNGRSIARWSLAELVQWRDRLRQEVRIEEQGDTAGMGRNIKVRFGRA